MLPKFYLAAPFFSPEQIHVLEEIEDKADLLGIPYFSPRKEFTCPPGASFATRTAAFEGNCRGIMTSSFVLGRIDDFDPGTVWELGYTYGFNKAKELKEMNDDNWSKKIMSYAFTTVPTRGLNLMLAQSCDGFLQGMPSVLKFLEDIALGAGDGEAKKWLEAII